MTSGSPLHTHPEPLQSTTGNTAMLRSGERTEVINGGMREIGLGKGHEEPTLKQGGDCWHNSFIA